MPTIGTKRMGAVFPVFVYAMKMAGTGLTLEHLRSFGVLNPTKLMQRYVREGWLRKAGALYCITEAGAQRLAEVMSGARSVRKFALYRNTDPRRVPFHSDADELLACLRRVLPASNLEREETWMEHCR